MSEEEIIETIAKYSYLVAQILAVARRLNEGAGLNASRLNAR